MANTIIIYQGDGSTTSFTVPFDYLKKTFVRVFLDEFTELKGGTQEDTSADYYFKDGTTIQLNKIVPSSNQTITIRRYTSVTDRVASFRDGSVLYAKDLDVSQVQAFHIAEEARDLLYDSLTMDTEGNWDAKNKRIIRVGTPVDATDAVTKKYVDDAVGIKKTLGEYEETTREYMETTKGYRDESLKSSIEAKASAGTAVEAEEASKGYRDETKVLHSEVLEKHTDVLVKHSDVVSKANQVSEDATQVSQDREIVEETSKLLEPILPYTDEVALVAKNIEHVVTDSNNINQINIVGTDLSGTLSDSLYDDYGTIGDTSPLPTITGGNIKIVADNIDNVNTVAGLAPDFETVVNSVATVKAFSESAQRSSKDAQEYATTAGSKASEASTQASNARNSAVASASSSTLAKNWAIKTDGTVADGEYSSKYYAQKAQESASKVSTEGATQIKAIQAEGSKQTKAVTDEGTAQKELLDSHTTELVGTLETAGTAQTKKVTDEGTKQVNLAKAEVATAKEASDNASVYAHSASESAKTATTEATTATTKAEEASDSATSAKGSATTATTQATNAKSSADSAKTSATGASSSASLAKKWATQTDSPVEGELYGAKYYAEQAQAGQTQANWNETDTTAVSFIKNKPTKVSAFTNDKGYLTTHQSLEGYAKETYVTTKVSALENKAYDDYGVLG